MGLLGRSGLSLDGLRTNARGERWVAAQVVLLVAFVALPPWPRAADGGPAPLRWLGWLVLAGGALAFALGIAALRSNLTPLPHPRDDAELVTVGIYRWVRHPIYSGVLALALGYALVRLSLGHGLATLALLAFLDAKSRREERWLRARFPGYARYAERVRRFIPGVY